MTSYLYDFISQPERIDAQYIFMELRIFKYAVKSGFCPKTWTMKTLKYEIKILRHIFNDNLFKILNRSGLE